MDEGGNGLFYCNFKILLKVSSKYCSFLWCTIVHTAILATDYTLFKPFMTEFGNKHVYVV